MAERTGCPVLSSLWPYVLETLLRVNKISHVFEVLVERQAEARANNG
jgi:hypothetical protein